MSSTIKKLIKQLNKHHFNSAEAYKLRKQLVKLETMRIKQEVTK